MDPNKNTSRNHHFSIQTPHTNHHPSSSTVYPTNAGSSPRRRSRTASSPPSPQRTPYPHHRHAHPTIHPPSLDVRRTVEQPPSPPRTLPQILLAKKNQKQNQDVAGYDVTLTHMLHARIDDDCNPQRDNKQARCGDVWQERRARGAGAASMGRF